MPFEAVQEITRNHRLKFSSQLLRILLSTLSTFPINTLVRLNSGAVGKVKQANDLLRKNARENLGLDIRIGETHQAPGGGEMITYNSQPRRLDVTSTQAVSVGHDDSRHSPHFITIFSREEDGSQKILEVLAPSYQRLWDCTDAGCTYLAVAFARSLIK